MAQSVYVSFDFDQDNSRVQQVLNMGAIEGQQLLSAQKWEEVKRSGDQAIQNWIDTNMANKPTLVVLVGAQTASSRWVDYEIRKAWDAGKRVVGVRIHGLKNLSGYTSSSGADPFAKVKLKNGRLLSEYVDLHNPSGYDSTQVYAAIKANLPTWVSGAKKTS